MCDIYNYARQSDQLNKITNLSERQNFNPIQDGPFWGCSQMGWQEKAPSLKSTNIAYKDKTEDKYTLPKEDLKKYKSHDTPFDFF